MALDLQNSTSVVSFQIISVLSSSEESAVFRVRHEQRDLAVKLVDKKCRRGLRDRFARYAALEYPYLVKIGFLVVEDTNENPEIVGYTMELFPKGSLEYYALLPETAHYRNIITPRRLYKWAIQLADAVKFLHKNEYIHGDISLRKILVSEDFGTVKLNFPSEHIMENDMKENYGLPQKNTKEYDVYSLLKVLYSLEHRKEAPEKLSVHDLRVDVSEILKDLIKLGCTAISELTAEKVYQILIDRENERPDSGIPQIKSKDLQYSSSITSNRQYVTFKATIKNDTQQKPYAAKVFSNKGQLKHIRREVNNLCELDHENIQKIQYLITSDNEDEIHGMLLEYMPNGSVGDYVYGERYYDDAGILIPEIIILWFVQLARALNYCHSKNIVHRNVRPTKMLLTKNWKIIQLTDFSMSRITDENMTSNVGVDPFRAPEAIDNTQFEDETACKLDVWSYGMSLYTCCNEERILPFQHEYDSKPQLRNRRRVWKEYLANDENRPNISLYDDFKTGSKYEEEGIIIVDIIKKCWRADPDLRPSMGDILDDIEKFG